MTGFPENITVVCTGNVCRSPMAEKLLQHALKAEAEPLASIQVTSAGLSAFPGDPASSNACKAMAAVDLDLSSHRSRPFTDQLADQSDLILVMTQVHRQLILSAHSDLRAPVHRFREWVNSGDPEVPDPFGGPLSLYKETRDSLAEAIPAILQFLRTHAKS